jgi:cytidylate kinase
MKKIPEQGYTVHKGEESEMPQNVIITISRQLGSGGSFIGRQVAERMGIKYIDREILHQAASLLHESENGLSAREERLSSFWERVMQAFCFGVPEAGYVPPPLRAIPDDELFATESKIIRRLAENCSVVIVGRAGFHILRGSPNLANVFLYAPKEFRIKRVMEIYNIDDAVQAEEMINDADLQRKKFVKVMTGTDWTDSLNYQLCIDTGAAGFTAATEMIVRLAEKIKEGSPK